MRLGIYGLGGLGREVYELAKIINSEKLFWEEILFIDHKNDIGSFNGAKAISCSRLYQDYCDQDIEISIALGEPAFRNEVYQDMLGHGYPVVSLVHPEIHLPSNTAVGNGCIISENCFISVNVCIGENVLIQPHTCIGHDSRIMPHSVLSTNVVICGNCTIGNRCYIGVNVPVKESVKIGDDVIVGMGSVVTRDIEDNVIALGNPARAMKKNDEKRVFSAHRAL